MLTFDPEKHEYHWSGRLVPNVTRILAPLTDYSRIPADKLETARQQGTALHWMVHLDIKDDLNIDTLPTWMEMYYEAWLFFRFQSGICVTATEEPLYHPTLGYAGTPDLIAKLPQLKGYENRWTLLDLKRSLYAGPVIGLQLAGYQLAWDATHEEKIAHRAALVLRGDGMFRLEPYNDPQDHATFLAALTMYRWKDKHGR